MVNGMRKSKLRFDYRSSRVLAVALPTIYAVVLAIISLSCGVLPGPEFIILCFFIYAAYNKRTQRFIADWFPFIIVFLSYEAMNSVVGSLSRMVNVVQPIMAEMDLFGSIPTLLLQQFYRTSFMDYLGAFFYSLHFMAPTFVGFLIWKYHPHNYRRYTIAIALGTYSALITFLVLPVAPPWYGVGATRVLFQVDKEIGVPVYKTVFEFLQANPFAAFPSLHAMYPWVISLYAFKIHGKKAIPVLLFPLGVWFSAVYLGEHYVVDLLGGVVYGTCAFLLAERIIPYLMQRRLKIPTIIGAEKWIVLDELGHHTMGIRNLLLGQCISAFRNYCSYRARLANHITLPNPPISVLAR